jgi:hypothetical protein
MRLLLILVFADFNENIVKFGKLNEGDDFAGLHVSHLISKNSLVFSLIEMRAGSVGGNLILLI